MKNMKWIGLVLLLLVLAGCTSEKKEVEKENTKDDDSVAVDKGLTSVEVTIPPSFMEGQDPDEVVASAKEEGLDVKKNEDGSLTYHMSKAEHKKIMKEMREQVTESLAEFEDNEDMPSVKKIEPNDDFSKFTVTADQEAFENSFDGFVLLGVGMSGLYYQLFDGVPADKNKVKIEVKDEQTGNVFSEVTYPDDLPNPDDEQDADE